MTRTITLVALLLLSGCKQMDEIIQPRRPTPEERAQQLYTTWLGLQLLQMSQPGPPPSRIFVIDGRQIVCTQMNNVTTCN
jgi:hypothetical protein